MRGYIGVILCIYWDKGNIRVIWSYIGVILDNGKSNGNYYRITPIMENQMEIELNAARACSEHSGHF